MFSNEYIYEMSQLIDIAISEYDILFHVLKLETLFELSISRNHMSSKEYLYTTCMNSVIYYNFSVHV